jgi:hypothetical protein
MLLVGARTAEFVSRTVDDAPDPFQFPPRMQVARATVVTSMPVRISGITTRAQVRISPGSEYSLRCAAGGFRSDVTDIDNGETICVRHMSGAAFDQATTSVLTVGSVQGTFTSITEAADTTPDAFGFTRLVGVPPNEWIRSSSVTVRGINTPVPISIENGEYAIGCGDTFTTKTGQVAAGQDVCVRHRSAPTAGTRTQSTLRLGGAGAIFESVTEFSTAEDSKKPVDEIPMGENTGSLHLDLLSLLAAAWILRRCRTPSPPCGAKLAMTAISLRRGRGLQ